MQGRMDDGNRPLPTFRHFFMREHYRGRFRRRASGMGQVGRSEGGLLEKCPLLFKRSTRRDSASIWSFDAALCWKLLREAASSTNPRIKSEGISLGTVSAEGGPPFTPALPAPRPGPCRSSPLALSPVTCPLCKFISGCFMGPH